MTIIGVVTKKDPGAKSFFWSIIMRSKDENILKNPFKIKAQIIEEKELFFLMDITPIYPPVYWFGFIVLIPFIIFQWINWFLLIPGALLSISFFWSAPFYLIVLFVSLKKKGYKGSIKVLSEKQIILRLAKWDK